MKRAAAQPQPQHTGPSSMSHGVGGQLGRDDEKVAYPAAVEAGGG